MSAVNQEDCQRCLGSGWEFADDGQCGDPECCGLPRKVRCPECDNDWSEDDE